MAKEHYKVVLELTARHADGVAFLTEWKVLTEWDIVPGWIYTNPDDPITFLTYGKLIVVPYEGKMTMFRVVGLTSTDIRVMLL